MAGYQGRQFTPWPKSPRKAPRKLSPEVIEEIARKAAKEKAIEERIQHLLHLVRMATDKEFRKAFNKTRYKGIGEWSSRPAA